MLATGAGNLTCRRGVTVGALLQGRMTRMTARGPIWFIAASFSGVGGPPGPVFWCRQFATLRVFRFQNTMFRLVSVETRSGPICFAPPAGWALKDWCRNGGIDRIRLPIEALGEDHTNC